MKALTAHDGRFHAAHADGGVRRPRQPLRTHDEQGDVVEPSLEEERRGLPVHEVGDRAAEERELLVAAERDGRREIQPPEEPGLHLVDPAARDLHGVLGVEHAQVIVERLVDDGVAPRPGRPVQRHDRRRGDDRRGGERREEARSGPDLRDEPRARPERRFAGRP